MSKMSQPNIFNDTPVSFQNLGKTRVKEQVSERDHLGTQDYAIAFAEFIDECDTPMTIGLQGDWGIGKTSLLNMIKAHLEGKQNDPYGIIWFNTWHYSLFGQEEYLGIAVIKGLLDQIKEQFLPEDKEDKFGEIAQKLGNVLKHAQFSAFGFGVKASDATTNNNDPDSGVEYDNISAIMLKFKESFQNLVNHVVTVQKKKKLVFFIDDIDRVKPIKALEMLESIKNFLDVENCVFLLAVDYEVVQIGMAQKLGQDLQKLSGKSFFDKIIQLPFTMPSASYDLGVYIQSLLMQSGFGVTADERAFYEDVTSCTVGRNPRSIKRVVNYCRLIRLIRKKNSDRSFKDSGENRKVLYALVCLQVAWPEIFNHLVKTPTSETIKNIEDWEYLDNIPYIEKLYDRSPNVDQVKSNVSSYFDLLYDFLDKDGDGNLSANELQPVHKMLEVARLSSTTVYKDPLEVFIELMRNNDSGKKYFAELISLFVKSLWKTSGKFDFRLSGTRYLTIIRNRKQIGSMVTLSGTRAFIFRLAIDYPILSDFFKQKYPEISEQYSIVKSLESASLTGFGDTQIDMLQLSKMEDKDILTVLNGLAQFIIAHYK